VTRRFSRGGSDLDSRLHGDVRVPPSARRSVLLVPGGRALQRPDLLANQRGEAAAAKIARPPASTTRPRAPQKPTTAIWLTTTDALPTQGLPTGWSLPANARRCPSVPANGRHRRE
jgi:hypothetical protein